MLLLLLACTGKGPAASDTATGPTGDDTGTPVDTQDTGPTSVALAGQLVLPEDTKVGASLTVGAVRITFGDGPAIGETLAATAADPSAPFTLELPASLSAQPALEADLQGTTGALFVLHAFEDTNGDGAWSEGEPLRGLAMDRFLAWIQDLPGVEDGWQLVDLGLAGQYAPNRCSLDSTVPLTWRAEEGYPLWTGLTEGEEIRLRGLPARLTIEGTIASVPEGVRGLVSLPYATVTGDAPDELPIFDLPAEAGPFSVELEAEPPDSHDLGSDPDWRYALELNLLYEDLDSDEAWSWGDAYEGSSTCVDDHWVYTRYTREVSSYRGYRFLDCYEGNVGWRLARTDEDTGAAVFLSSEEATRVVVDPTSCRLD